MFCFDVFCFECLYETAPNRKFQNRETCTHLINANINDNRYKYVENDVTIRCLNKNLNVNETQVVEKDIMYFVSDVHDILFPISGGIECLKRCRFTRFIPWKCTEIGE